MKCLDGCGKCCWAVPIPRETWDRHREDLLRPVAETWEVIPDQILPITKDLRCPFLSDEDRRCTIYEDRPPVCRNYGKRGHTCPYVKPDGTPRTERGTRQIEARRGFCLDDESNVYIRRKIPSPRDGYTISLVQTIRYEKETPS